MALVAGVADHLHPVGEDGGSSSGEEDIDASTGRVDLNSTGPLPLHELKLPPAPPAPPDVAVQKPRSSGGKTLDDNRQPDAAKPCITSGNGFQRLLTGVNSHSPLFRKLEAAAVAAHSEQQQSLDEIYVRGATDATATEASAPPLLPLSSPPTTPSPSSSSRPLLSSPSSFPPPSPNLPPPTFTFEACAAACIEALRPYAAARYNVYRGGLLVRRAVPLERVLTWKARCISTSLTVLPPQAAHEAVCCFKSVLAFMGDRSSGFSPSEHAGKLVTKAMHYAPDLLDELYCQICKQTTGNPDPVSAAGGWQLLLALLAVTQPGPALLPCLLAFARCSAALSPRDCQARAYAAAAAVCLEKIPAMEPRGNYLTYEELRSIVNLRGVPLVVYLVDASTLELRVDSWTTVGETATMVAARLGLGDSTPFRLFEETLRPGGDRRTAPLPPARRVLDAAARWQRLEAAAEEPRLLYMVHLRLPAWPAEDAAMNEMMFLQAMHDFTSGAYPPPPLPDAIRMAALQLQHELGDATVGDDRGGCSGNDHGSHEAYLVAHLPRFVPEHWLIRSEQDDLVKQVLAAHANQRGAQPAAVERKYLQLAARQPFYGHRVFRVRRSGAPVLLGVGARGLLLLDARGTAAELARMRYSELLTWGCSAKDYFFVTARDRRLVPSSHDGSAGGGGRNGSSGSGGGGSGGNEGPLAFQMDDGDAERIYALVQEYVALSQKTLVGV